MPVIVHSLRSTQWVTVTIMSQIHRISQWLFDLETNCASSQVLTDLSVARQLSQQLPWYLSNKVHSVYPYISKIWQVDNTSADLYTSLTNCDASDEDTCQVCSTDSQTKEV